MTKDENYIYDYINVRNKNKTLSNDEFEEILSLLTKRIFDYGIENILNDFLEQYNKNYMKDWENLKNMKITDNLISSTKITGLKVIKKNMKHIYKVENYKGQSIWNLWTVDVLKKVLKINRKTHSTPYISEILRQIGFISGTSKITIYRPLLTKRIVEYFDSKKILDVCVGWGGRMIGSLCIDNVEYTGIEPCKETFDGLIQIKDDLKLQNVILYNECAENVLKQLPNDYYDLLLTSPPFFNLEIYSQEKTQSHYYGNYESWCEHFLKPVVYQSLDKLKKNGKSCWSVKNFKTDKQYNLLDQIISYHKDKGWKLSPIEFGIKSSLRPGINKNSIEKTFVFLNS